MSSSSEPGSTTQINGQIAKPIIAIVTLASPNFPRGDDLLRELTMLHADADCGDLAEQADKLLSFSYNDNLAAISLVPAPLPWHELEGPCATAWWWPQATDEMQRHTQHLLVALLGSEGNKLSRTLDATRLVSAATKLSNSIGIYWGAGAIVHQAEEFVRQAGKSSREHAPIHLWIDMRLEQNGDHTYRFFTTGLSQFGKKEIEIPHTARQAQEVFEFTYDLIHYIVTHDIKLAEGESVGRTTDQRVRVIERPSMVNPQQTVLSIDY